MRNSVLYDQRKLSAKNHKIFNAEKRHTSAETIYVLVNKFLFPMLLLLLVSSVYSLEP